MTQPPSTLWPILGAVRFFLALVVAGNHLPAFIPASATIAEPVMWLFRLSGGAAVIGFLVLSGYSIAASLEKDAAHFYFRRALRIIPVYAAAVLFSSAMPLWFGNEHDLMPMPWGGHLEVGSMEETLMNLFFMQGFIADPLTSNRPVWTIALEVFFYALAPHIAKTSDRWLHRIILASAVFFAFACLFLNAGGGKILSHGLMVPVYAWAWLLGFCLYREKSSPRSIIAAFTLGCLAIPLFFRADGLVIGYPWYPIPWAVTLGGLYYGASLKLSAGALSFCKWLGDISYPVYLIHLPVFAILAVRGNTDGIAAMAFVVIVAAVIDLLYDKPIKRLVSKIRSPMSSPPLAG